MASSPTCYFMPNYNINVADLHAMGATMEYQRGTDSTLNMDIDTVTLLTGIGGYNNNRPTYMQVRLFVNPTDTSTSGVDIWDTNNRFEIAAGNCLSEMSLIMPILIEGFSTLAIFDSMDGGSDTQVFLFHYWRIDKSKWDRYWGRDR